MIKDGILSGLSHFEVSIAGGWVALPKRDWQGHAECRESIVGVAMLQTPSALEWSISTPNNSEVRLAIFPYDRQSLDVQVNFSVGYGGRRGRALLYSSSYLPSIRLPLVMQTGQVFTFATIDGEPRIDLKILFIAHRDVKVGRNRIWHVRPELAASLHAPFHRMLTYGRTGQIQLEGHMR